MIRTTRFAAFVTLLVAALVGAACAPTPDEPAPLAETPGGAVDGGDAPAPARDAATAPAGAGPVAVAPLPRSGAPVDGLRYHDDRGRVRVALIKMPYSGARNVPELSDGPDYLEEGGLAALLRQEGAVVRETEEVRLLPEEESQYGEWRRMGLANGHYADLVAGAQADGWLTVGLLSNCTSLLGTLAGLQASGSGGQPRRIALVFIDSHGDFNTPETTLSGMLGGMPVAVAAGMCLTNLRDWSGLEHPLPTGDIVMGAVRDLDPLERELVENSEIQHLTVGDIRGLTDEIDGQIERLAERADLIYVHIDMDVLDPAEVPGHPLTVPDGPTSLELAAALERMFAHPRVAALGIASTPWGERDPGGVSRQAAYNLVLGAVRGVQSR